MAVRRETVRLELDDAGFSTGMLRAAAATALLDRRLTDLNDQQVDMRRLLDNTSTGIDRFRRTVDQTGRPIDQFGSGLRRNSAEVDRFSGRLRIMIDALSVLGPSIVPIAATAVPAITGLAAQLGFAAIGMSSLLVAANGVGDAIKTIQDAHLEPTAANLEKAEIAMGKLGPEARAFVLQFQDLRPALGDIKDAAERGWFPGLTEALVDFERVAPQVGSLLEKVGSAGGNLVAEGAEALAGPKGQEFLAFLEDNAPQALEELGRTLGNVTAGMAELWMSFDPLNDDFSTWLLNASRSFADWSANLDETEGFAEFVDYIRESGPKVADMFQAVGSAVVELTEALAPLGGPSLKIIETFAEGVAAIADSDIGTPFLAGVAALALWNRAMQASIAMQTRLGMTAVAAGRAPGGPAGAGGIGIFGAGAPGRGGPSLRQAGGDLRAYTALRTQILARTAAETARMNAASASARANLAGVAKSAAPAATALGAFALVASDTEKTLIGANAGMGLIIGSFAGPWGAAIGLATGNLLDFRAGLKEVDEILKSGDQLSAIAALEKRRTTLTDPAAFLTGRTQTLLAQDLYSKVTTGESATSKLSKEAAGMKAGASLGDLGITNVKELDKYLKDLETTKRRDEAATLGLTSATSDFAAAQGYTNSEIARAITLMDERTNAARGAFGAETQWREALRSAGELAKTNNAGIRGSSEAAIANRSALDGLSAAWLNQREAMEANGASAERIDQKYRAARRAFVQTATAMGVPIDRARVLARTLLNIPEKRAAKVTVDTGAAISSTSALEQRLNNLNGKTVTTYVVTRNMTKGAGSSTSAADPARGSADGSTVPRDGGPYRDRYPYMLAPGEEIISNRFGQADRHRSLLKAINAGALADGGTAGRSIKVPASAIAKARPQVVRHEISVHVTGEMDLDRAKAQLRGVVAEEIDQDKTWSRTQ